MKKIFLFFVLMTAMPASMMAQDDDLYFTPSKNKAEKTTVDKRKDSSINDKPAYYVGSNRDVDEYNRRGKFRSSFQKIGVDSLGNDIIEFQAGTGIYPDSTYVDTMWVSQEQNLQEDEDYKYSRRMSRWDGYYGWYDPWYYGHWGYRWYDPWYYDWYDPWYYGYYGWGYYGWNRWGWYDPWYYRYGWYDPWYYGWGGYYYGGGYGGYSNGIAGTGNHGAGNYGSPRGTFNGRSHSYSNGTFGGSRAGTFGSRTSTASRSNGSIRVNSRNSSGTYSNSNGNFGGSRSSGYSGSSSRGSYSAPSRSSSSSGYSGGGGGTFGGSRSSGGGGGGGRSGGGGFGGRR
ncbi:MAG: hypothetical protein K6C10_06435 [Prevotella sp.]|nr:hypothetical protein [Prevotella sp.]